MARTRRTDLDRAAEARDTAHRRYEKAQERHKRALAYMTAADTELAAAEAAFRYADAHPALQEQTGPATGVPMEPVDGPDLGGDPVSTTGQPQA